MPYTETTERMLAFMKDVLDRIGPRPSCGNRENALADQLVEQWRAHCDDVRKETFTCHPVAFLGLYPISVIFYLLALVFYWQIPMISLVLMLLILIALFLEAVRYREFVDPLFPRRESSNVIGTIQPTGEVQQRVIISGHMDSAYEFNLWYFFKNGSVPVMVTAVFALLYLFGISLMHVLGRWQSWGSPDFYVTLGIIAVVLYPVVGLFLFFHTFTPVPGAMDDLAGVAVTGAVGETLRKNASGDAFFPQHTEVVLIAMGSEEAGLRGAKRYVKRHQAQLKRIPTYGIFLDGLSDERHLSVVDREICPGATHDPELVALAQKAAVDNEWPIKTTVIPIGASDAAAFSIAGVPSVCLLCQDTTRLVPNYHTRLDTLDNLRPESLTRSHGLVLGMLAAIDAKIS